MSSLLEVLDYENPVLRAYMFWTSILVLKMLAMSYLTGNERKRKKIIPNPEDKQFIEGAELKYDDPDVERVRRSHRNDLENCLPFMIIGFLYVLSNPSTFLAVNLFRVGVIARIVHTYAYAISPMQPARGIGFGICFMVTAYMSLATALSFCC